MCIRGSTRNAVPLEVAVRDISCKQQVQGLIVTVAARKDAAHFDEISCMGPQNVLKAACNLGSE